MEFYLFAIYVGPDQVMPVMSILATIMGFLLVFWNKVVGIFRKIFRLNRPDAPASATDSAVSAKHNEPGK